MVSRLTIRASLLSGCVVLAGTITAAAQSFEPAEYKGGPQPAVPVLALGGGEVLLEATVAETGRVTAVKILRATDSFTVPMTDAVRHWTFTPALEVGDGPAQGSDRRPIASKVVVAGFFRAPVLMGPTLGEPVRDVGTSTADAPRVLRTQMPSLPPTVFSAGVVLAEVTIDSSGRAKSKIVIPGAGFDSATLDALKQWTFAPARVDGRAVPSRVYVFFSFPLPVDSAHPVQPPGGAPVPR
jgi:hypothetical protein